MVRSYLYYILRYSFAAIWLVNGLYCKVLQQVPRHQAIVENILSGDLSGPITQLIGLAETGMAIWIISGYRTRLNTWVQIGLIGLMNLLEFALVPALLLWGRWNLLFAIILMCTIYLTEFLLKPSSPPN